MQTLHSPEIGLKRAPIQISPRTLAILRWSGLAVALAGLGLLVAMNMSYARARYPGSRTTGQAHSARLSVFSGRLSETGRDTDFVVERSVVRIEGSGTEQFL